MARQGVVLIIYTPIPMHGACANCFWERLGLCHVSGYSNMYISYCLLAPTRFG